MTEGEGGSENVQICVTSFMNGPFDVFRAAASRREVVGSGDPIRGRSRLFLEQLRAQVRDLPKIL